MTDIDVAKRLEELRLFTKQPLNVEQRIEIAKQQQAIRDAKKMAKDELARVKEKVIIFACLWAIKHEIYVCFILSSFVRL